MSSSLCVSSQSVSVSGERVSADIALKRAAQLRDETGLTLDNFCPQISLKSLESRRLPPWGSTMRTEKSTVCWSFIPFALVFLALGIEANVCRWDDIPICSLRKPRASLLPRGYHSMSNKYLYTYIQSSYNLKGLAFLMTTPPWTLLLRHFGRYAGLE